MGINTKIMKMYKIRSWGTEIEEIEITRHTKSRVWFMRGTNELYESRQCYHETWNSARLAIVDREQKKVDEAKDRVKYATEEYFKALKIEVRH